jgi:superfamily I DNA/RNA helicase
VDENQPAADRDGDRDDVTRFDAEHDAIIACPAHHQLVVAPPGTGKTFLSIRLAATITAELPEHARVLLLTFSRQARSQLESEAARQLTREQRARIEITNYHRLAWQAVTAYRRCLDLPDVLDIGSSKRRAAALREGCPEGFAAIKQHDGLIDSIGEHAFPALRDQRSPPPKLRDALLAIVIAEQRAGRLVFDDLGALLWRLLEEHPTIAAAYAARYPAVIADEHQDASGLQDAIVRRFGTRRLVVLADHLQLIHSFRGADLERLRAHWRESGGRHELHSPHRWYGRQREGAWLLALRERLQDRFASAPRPDGLGIVRYPAERGQNGAIFHTRLQVLALLDEGHRSIAVLVRNNQDLARVRNHLVKHGLYPRQLGGPRDFEEAREDIEQLPLLVDAFSLVEHARKRLLAIVPSIPTNVVGQVQRRLKPEGADRKAAQAEADALLACFEPLYDAGANAYFHAMDRLLATCARLGYHLPRSDATAAIRRTAAALAEQVDLEHAVGTYSEQVLAVSHSMPARTDRGLFVMTAHQAKGKEFDAVVLYALDERFWPDDGDEHRRLFYVAMTRATRSWRLIAPDAGASPLLQVLPG